MTGMSSNGFADSRPSTLCTLSQQSAPLSNGQQEALDKHVSWTLF